MLSHNHSYMSQNSPCPLSDYPHCNPIKQTFRVCGCRCCCFLSPPVCWALTLTYKDIFVARLLLLLLLVKFASDMICCTINLLLFNFAQIFSRENVPVRSGPVLKMGIWMRRSEKNVQNYCFNIGQANKVICHKFWMTFFLVQYSEIINVLYTLYMTNMTSCIPVYIYIYTFIFPIYIFWPNFDVMSNGHCVSQVNQNYSQPMLSHSPTTTYQHFYFSDPPKHVVTFFQAPGRYFLISTCISLRIVTKLWRHVKRPLRDSC